MTRLPPLAKEIESLCEWFYPPKGKFHSAVPDYWLIFDLLNFFWELDGDLRVCNDNHPWRLRLRRALAEILEICRPANIAGNLSGMIRRVVTEYPTGVPDSYGGARFLVVSQYFKDLFNSLRLFHSEILAFEIENKPRSNFDKPFDYEPILLREPPEFPRKSLPALFARSRGRGWFRLSWKDERRLKSRLGATFFENPSGCKENDVFERINDSFREFWTFTRLLQRAGLQDYVRKELSKVKIDTLKIKSALLGGTNAAVILDCLPSAGYLRDVGAALNTRIDERLQEWPAVFTWWSASFNEINHLAPRYRLVADLALIYHEITGRRPQLDRHQNSPLRTIIETCLPPDERKASLPLSVGCCPAAAAPRSWAAQRSRKG